MTILAIDDEPRSLHLLQKAIQEAAPQAEVLAFPGGPEAIEAIRTQVLRPDFIFSDIQMPEIDGLQLAIRLRSCAPEAKLVFVTAFSNYALDAYQLHASGYIMKPVSANRIRDELENHAPQTLQPAASERTLLTVRCFGQFEVFWQGVPLSFGRQNTKELLAYLIDRRGAYLKA